MIIYAVDDEPNMLYLLHEAIANAAPEAQIEDYNLSTAALERMEKNGARPDVIFSDIRMPGLSGLELAIRTELLDCDYYRALAGDPAAKESFHGEYMEQYSWAEPTKGGLVFRFLR